MCTKRAWCWTVFENSLEVSKLFGPYRERVKRKWGKLFSEELYDLYSLLNIIKWKQINDSEMGGAYSTHEEGEKCIKCLAGNSEGKRQLWGRRCCLDVRIVLQ